VIERLVILGANSDVVGRFVVPALVSLWAAGDLPSGIEVTGVARQDWDHDRYRDHLVDELADHAPDLDPAARDAVLDRIRYHRADTTRADELEGVFAHDHASEPAAIYLALPPAIFPPTIEALAELGIPEGSRLVVEKPFGEDLDDARELNELLHRHVPEDHIHRIDHFLGLATVHDLLGLRFGNRILEPIWNCHHVERVDIVWDETLTLEGRAGYYDQTGALKDMLQNHLLQVLALVAMEPPTTLDERDLRDRKAQLLREVRPMSIEEAAQRSVRGRYTAGTIGGHEVPAYLDEEGVDADNETETFAAMTLEIDNWRWAGVPFRLRSGKALGRERQEVVVRFRDVPHRAFQQGARPEDDTGRPNELRLRFEPDSLELRINVTGQAVPFALEPIELVHETEPPAVPAYGVVLRSVLQGDPTLSIRGDEAERSWEIVKPVLAAWARGMVELEDYPAGSDGPDGPDTGGSWTDGS
jgi:glucose-6-phosphate 1-dehydrogenase